MQKVLLSNFKRILPSGDILNCFGKTVKDSDVWIINSLLIHGQ